MSQNFRNLPDHFAAKRNHLIIWAKKGKMMKRVFFFHHAARAKIVILALKTAVNHTIYWFSYTSITFCTFATDQKCFPKFIMQSHAYVFRLNVLSYYWHHWTIYLLWQQRNRLSFSKFVNTGIVEVIIRYLNTYCQIIFFNVAPSFKVQT